jgi:hypothetical protein
MKTETASPLFSLEDILWEHREFSVGLKKLFDKYQKRLETEERAQYDRETQRIVFNTIGIITEKTGITGFEVFVEDFNKSLKMLIVFSDVEFEKKKKDLYELLPKIQDMAIIHEGRDFRWNLMSDKYLNKEILQNEFVHSLRLENK